MRIEHLPLLKKLVETAFGKKILSFKECKELGDDVFKKTGSLISINTLRRFFGLVKSNHLPSYSTLNVLANYCGFSSFADLQALDKNQLEKREDSGLLLYMVSLFKETVVSSTYDSTYLDLVKLTIHFLHQNPHLIDPFQQEIAKTRNGQNFYFEQFVHLDQLNGSYGNGLKYYLAQKKTTEAQVFGHGLLALRYWLTSKDELFDIHYGQVTGYEIDSTIHPFVAGRYFGIKLLKMHTLLSKENLFLEGVRKYYHQSVLSNNHPFPYFEYSFALTLILTAQWTEALYYTEAGIEKQNMVNASFIHRHLFEHFYLFKAMALAATGQVQAARVVYARINAAEFFFLSRQFFTILYLQLGIQIKPGKTANKAEQLKHLIEETGFKKLEWAFRNATLNNAVY